MRNLKRALSLTLASVMLLGMMVVGSSAAAGYDDVSKDDNVEAIEVLQAVEVMVGDERGFGPERPVTRAEMAVVMAKLLSLDYNYYSATCPFDDVYDWARGYVGACYANKVLSGRGDGIYDPGATVTAVEAALMLMRALGYFQYSNDYTDGWDVATVRQGTIIGIFDGVGSSATEPMTRNQVAQMVLNALRSAVVEPDGNTTTFLNPDGTVLATTGKVNYVSVTSNQPYARAISKVGATSVGSTNDGAIVELGERLYDGKLKLDEYTTDAFLRPSRHWEFDGKDIGTYVKKELIRAEYTTEVTGKMLYELLTAPTIRDYDFTIAIDGETEKTDLDKGSDTPYFTKNNLLRTNTLKVGATGNGVLTQVFVDPDEGANGAVYIAIINTYLAKAIDDYNEKKDEVTYKVWSLRDVGTSAEPVLVKNTTKDTDNTTDLDVSGEDFDIKDVQKNDIVLVNVAEGEIKEIIDPETLDNTTINSFKRNSWLNAEGTQYDYSDTILYDPEVLDEYDEVNMKETNYRVFLDEYGYAIGLEIIEEPNQYVFLTGIDLDTSNLANKTADGFIIHTDGTSETVKINMDKSENAMGNKFNGANNKFDPADDATGTAVSSLMNTWCKYTTNAAGVYTLTEVPNDNASWALASKSKAAQGRNHDETANTGATPGDGVELVTLDKSHIYLQSAIDAYKRVYTNDNTVFLTAETDKIIATNVYDPDNSGTNNTDTNSIIISGVDSVATGASNVNLKAWDATKVLKEGGTKYTGVDSKYTSNGVYTLFDKDGYVIAAVVVGEDDGTTTNYAFVISSDMTQEDYTDANDEWTWHRDVIINGELVTLTEKGDGRPEIGNIGNGKGGKMYQGEWAEVKYYADGTVRSVTPLSLNRIGGTAVRGTDMPAYDFDSYPGAGSDPWTGGKYLYNISDVEAAIDDNKNTFLVWDNLTDVEYRVYVEGSTLQVETASGAKNGFTIHPNAKTVLIQDGEPTIYSMKWMDSKYYQSNGTEGAKRAVDRLEDNDAFKGFIGAVIEDGRATSIVIYDKTSYSINQGTGTPGNNDDTKLPRVEADSNGDLTYYYYDSEFNPKDWATIRANAANAAAAYYNVDLVRNGIPVTSGNGSHTGTGADVALDDGSLRGEPVGVTIQRMVKVTKDGAFVAYVKADGNAQTVTLDNGTYILGSKIKIANGDSEKTTVSGVGGTDTVSITPALTATDADVAFNTAYQIVALNNNVTATLASDTTVSVTATNWVKKDTVLSVTGDTGTGAGLMHQLVATVGGNDQNIGTAVKDAAAGDKATASYKVSSGNVTFSETAGYTVKVPGKSMVLDVNDKIQFTGAHANAVYAAKKNVTDGHASTLTAGTLDSLGTLYEYTVAAADADSGEIELVQVAKVTLAGTGLTAASCTYKKVGEAGASTGAITTTEYYEIGATLHIVGATAADATEGDVILVTQPNGGTAALADANGTAESDTAGNTSASADYVIKSADYDLNFSKGAAPT